jgi:hypothetical protein
MRSAATSEFDEDFGRSEVSEQTGFDDMDIDNNANDEDSGHHSDNGRSNKNVSIFSLLIMTTHSVY